MYPPCTSLGQIRCFWRFCRLIESITYGGSIGLRIPIPTAHNSFLISKDLVISRGSKRQQKSGERRSVGHETGVTDGMPTNSTYEALGNSRGRSGRCSNRCPLAQKPLRSFNRRSSRECAKQRSVTHETSREYSPYPRIMRCLRITFSVVVRVSSNFLSIHSLGYFSPDAAINSE